MSYENPARNVNVLVVCQAGVKLAIPIPREVSAPVFIGTVASVDGERCIVFPLGGSNEETACKFASVKPEPGNIVLVIRQSGDWFCHPMDRGGKA